MKEAGSNTLFRARNKMNGQLKHYFKQLINHPILVAESDGFVLRALVAHSESGKIKVDGWAESRAHDPSVAVAEICTQLRQRLGGLPSKAYMMPPGLVMALLELPVEPDKPRPASQMQELIRWEIDPFISEFDDLWNIGAILQASGFLSAQQRAEIATELEKRLAQRDRNLQRFGELALERRFIDREQLVQCLAIQEKLVSRDVNLSCGWALQQWGDGDDLQYTWLVGAMSDLRRKHWYNSFSRAGVRLEQFHPIFGAVIPLLSEQQDSRGERLLLELHQEQIACLRVLNDKTIVSLQITPRPLDEDQLAAACVTLCSEQMRSGIDTVWLHSASLIPAKLVSALTTGLEREVNLLTTQDLDPNELPLPLSECLSLYGLAQSLLDNKKYQPLAIPATEPSPPIWKNIEFWRFAVPVVFCLGLIGHLVWGHLYLAEIRQKRIQIETEGKQKSRLSSAAKQLAAEVNQLNTEIQSKQKALEDVNQRLHLIEALIKRKTDVPLFLRALADAINPYVVIERLVESQEPPGFQLTTWAIHDSSAQQFAKQLEVKMADLGYMVADIELKTAKGRTGVDGYGVNIWLVPVIKHINKSQNDNKAKQ
jgi:hypothetical protein